MKLLLILVLLYLLFGLLLWYTALAGFGGKDEYVKYLQEQDKSSEHLYYLYLIVWTLLWPLFIAIGKDKESHK